MRVVRGREEEEEGRGRRKAWATLLAKATRRRTGSLIL